jgi:site-specific recombinase XerD
MLRFAEYLELQDFRQTTSGNYYRAVGLIAKHFDRDPASLGEEDVRAYFVHVRGILNWAPKSCRQHLAAMKHFYRGMLGRAFESLDQIKARDRETLPTVLMPEEVARVISAVPLLRYRVPLLLIYACGLRVRECVHLTVDDIDGTGNRLFVRDGKGGKDRYTILGTPVYGELRRYWCFHKNRKFVFPAVGRGLRDSGGAASHMAVATEPMDTNSLRTHLRKAAQKAGVTKKVTCHILRHSFATHLAAMGVPLHQIQAYLGHQHIETTTVYTHLTPISHVEAIGYVNELVATILKR